MLQTTSSDKRLLSHCRRSVHHVFSLLSGSPCSPLDHCDGLQGSTGSKQLPKRSSALHGDALPERVGVGCRIQGAELKVNGVSEGE